MERQERREKRELPSSHGSPLRVSGWPSSCLYHHHHLVSDFLKIISLTSTTAAQPLLYVSESTTRYSHIIISISVLRGRHKAWTVSNCHYFLSTYLFTVPTPATNALRWFPLYLPGRQKSTVEPTILFLSSRCLSSCAVTGFLGFWFFVVFSFHC